MGPTTTWLLLAVAMVLLSGTLLGTISAERRPDTDGTGGIGDGGDEDDDDYDDGNSHEFEEKILRAWIEKLFERYNKNIQSPIGSTNIQRIAKKSTSKMSMLDHEHIAAVSIYPFLVNPFYQPSIYTNYIPLPYDAMTHQYQLPVGQVPYQKEEYHHRFFGPLHNQFPVGYTNVPGIMSSTLINNDLEIQKTMNVPNHIPPNNQEVIHKYDKELHISEQIPNENQDDFDHSSPIGLNPEHPMKIDKKKNDKIEQSNSKTNRKLHDHIIVDDGLDTITSVQNQTTGSLELDTSIPLDSVNFQKTYPASTLLPLTISNEPGKSEIYSNSGSQLSLSSDDYELITVKQILSQHSTTQEPSTFSNTEQLITSVETYSSTTSDKNQEDIFTYEERSRPDEPQNANHYSNDKYTTDILKAPIINIEKISTEMVKTTQNSEILNASSTLPTITTTTLYSTPLSENNDFKISTSSHVNAPRAKTNIQTEAYDIPIQMFNGKSGQKFTKVSDEQNNITDLISLSTRPPVISITTSKTSTLPYTKSSSSIILTSSPSYPKYYSSTISPYVKSITNQNNKIQSTNLRHTSLLPIMLHSLSTKNITTSILVETKTEQTPLISLNSNKYTNNIKQNTNIPRDHDESTRSSSTPIIFIPSHDVFNTGSPVNAVENNLPSGINMYSNSNQSQKISTSTEKLNTHKDDNINYSSFPITTKGTKRSTLKPTVTTLKQYNSVQRKIPLTTFSDDSKFRKTTNNPDLYVNETPNTPQSIKESELWYNHMYPQNPLQKEINEEQIHVLLKKIIKLLKPEIEKQTLTKESVARLVPPRLGDPEKFVYIIYPWVIDAAKNMENEEQTKINSNPLTTSDKL